MASTVPVEYYGQFPMAPFPVAFLVEAAMAGDAWKDGHQDGYHRGFEDGCAAGLEFCAPDTGNEDYDRGYSEGFEAGCEQRRQMDI
jgi:hypothetical protein